MNHTTNYNLPQWEDTDRVTRTDMNAAMSAIDTAIAGQGIFIKSGDLRLDGRCASASMADVDFAQWHGLHIVFSPQSLYSCKLRIGGATFGEGALSGKKLHVYFHVYNDPLMYAQGVLTERGKEVAFLSETTYKSMTEVQLETIMTYTITGGTYELYGYK